MRHDLATTFIILALLEIPGAAIGVEPSAVPNRQWQNRGGPGFFIVCTSDADCPSGYVCETSVTGECNSSSRVCVPGCRVGKRPCEAGLQCVDAVCKTCPCPDTCITPDASFCNIWGFEAGMYMGWTCLSGKYGASNTIQACPTSTMHQLVNPGNDAQSLQRVSKTGGLWAVRIGDMQRDSSGGDAAALQKTFTVSLQTAVLRYSYALVFENPNPPHTAAQQPYFRARASVGSKSVYDALRVSNPSDSFFTTGADGTTLLRRWSCGVIDLTPYIGQVATVQFEASDCSPGGHLGYAYLDFMCNPPTVQLNIPAEICEGPVIADGSANDGVVDHFWSVELSDANFGRNPMEEVGAWFAGPPPAAFDVAAFAASHGKPMLCGKYYRVKLAVKTECEPWLETVRLVYVKCPPKAFAGADQIVCATHPYPVTVGQSSALPGVTYAWTANGSPAGNTSALTVTPSMTTVFTLTATNTANQCSTTSQSIVTFVPDMKPVLDLCYCAPATILTAQVPGYVGPSPTFLWSTGATRASISVQPAATTTYSVTVATPCDTHAAAITLDEVPDVKLIAPNTLVPYSPIPKNNHFWIVHLGMSEHQKPAYGATGWEFTVWDRWGQIIYKASHALNTCGAFGNVELPGWNGVANFSDREHSINAGNLVPIGVYTYGLRILNCQEIWKDVKVNGDLHPSLTVLY